MKIRAQKRTIVLLLLALATTAWASVEFSKERSNGATDEGVEAVARSIRAENPEDAFNGIKHEEFENFYRDWRLVTARYRIDRDQQRVTFANPIAWKALVEGSKAFPEGSMFVKTGFQSAEDPLFPSSKTPGSQLRLLVMKRDFKKYPNTDGWGYALLNRFGARLSNGEIKYKVDKYKSITEFETACHACHKIAAAQDFVFSKPMFEAALDYKNAQVIADTFEQKFAPPGNGEMLKQIQSILEDTNQTEMTRAEKFYSLEMPLFEGSLPELKAPLSNLANRKAAPFVVYSTKTELFAMSIPLSAKAGCLRRELFLSGCLDKTIPKRNLTEVTKSAILCDGITVEEKPPSH